MRTDIIGKKDQILQWIKEQQSKAFICQQLRCKPETLNSYLDKMGIQYSGNKGLKGKKHDIGYKSAMYYIDNNIPIKSHRLKEKLIKDGIKANRCEICGIFEWMGKLIPLELHHKNGNHYCNDLDNLMILCPNCHSIQEGHCGANMGKYASVSELAQETDLGSVGSNTSCEFESRRLHHCLQCGKVIRESKSGLCRTCYEISTRRVKRPDRETLKYEIRNFSFLELSRKYNVSDNAIRKWCIDYQLPKSKNKIKKYSDDEWQKL